MGFELPTQNVEVEWDASTEFPGLVVTFSLDAPADLVFRVGELAQRPERSDEFRAAMRDFGDGVIVSWNLERGGVPVPASGDGLLSQPLRFMRAMFSKFNELVTAEGPLGRQSSDITSLAGQSTPRAANT